MKGLDRIPHHQSETYNDGRLRIVPVGDLIKVSVLFSPRERVDYDFNRGRLVNG